MNLINNSNKSPFKAILIILIIIIVLVPKKNNLINNFVSEIESLDTGYSSFNTMYVTLTENEDNLGKKVSNLIVNSIKLISNKKDFNDRPSIQKVYLDIKFKNYKKLLKDREEAVLNQISIDFQDVKGEITFEGKKIKCDVRLKGDLSAHWSSPKRMSFRVKLKGDNSILGFKTFSLHKPSARQHPYDQVFQDLQKEIGNISSSHNYVNLYVNGENWGIVNIEEHMSKELLEKQNLKESLILKFGDERAWAYTRLADNPYMNYKLSDKYLNIKIYNEKKYLNNIYRKWYSYILKEHLKQKNQLYDNDSFSKSLILAYFSGTIHTLYSTNSRYYFNPYNLKLHPITTDQSSFQPLNNELNLPSPYEKIVYSNEFIKRFEQNLKKVKATITRSNFFIEKWQNYFPLDTKLNSDILISNSKIINNSNDLLSKIAKANSNEKIPYVAITEKQSKQLLDHIYARHYDNGEIKVYNLINEELTIKKIELNGKKLKGFENISVEKHNQKYVPKSIQTGLVGLYDNEIKITTKHLGNERTFKLGITNIKDSIYNPLTKNSNLSNIKFLKRENNGDLTIKSGEWEVEKPLVINESLNIEKGTTLKFSNNSYLIVKGAININGSVKHKVILTSKDKSWKGLYVLESKNKSIISNTEISNTTNLTDGILNLTGSVTFYKSDVEIINTSFKNSKAEDFLNIVHSNFTIKNVSIENSVSDGFDSDFSNGEILNSNFKNIQGDAVDFSGSNVKIKKSFFYNIKDKSISAGESSELSIYNCEIQNTGVGIASKDGSIIFIENSKISNYKLYGLMSYQKKSFYKANTQLISINNTFDDRTKYAFRQIGSELYINDELINESDLDVDKLYQLEIMKKSKE